MTWVVLSSYEAAPAPVGGKADEDGTQEWLQSIIEAAQAGLSPSLATMKIAEYGDANMDLALRGLELKTLDPYVAGWRMRVVSAQKIARDLSIPAVRGNGSSQAMDDEARRALVLGWDRTPGLPRGPVVMRRLPHDHPVKSPVRPDCFRHRQADDV
ncbi:hypothetical protein [Streptomyces sp. NPDC051665]|uniref:hypothetical protein n=1 Tax=Streptomyces sp. NPDC051665 TaxID=3154647 RepID=UPI003433C9B5